MEPILTSKEKAKHKRLMDTYGLSFEEWEVMWNRQGGVCWVCQTLPKNGILCVDHRHVPKYKKLKPEEKKREVRALLCFQCNTSFGRIERRKNPRKLLERVVQYFNSFPMKGDL